MRAGSDRHKASSLALWVCLMFSRVHSLHEDHDFDLNFPMKSVDRFATKRNGLSLCTYSDKVMHIKLAESTAWRWTNAAPLVCIMPWLVTRRFSSKCFHFYSRYFTIFLSLFRTTGLSFVFHNTAETVHQIVPQPLLVSFEPIGHAGNSIGGPRFWADLLKFATLSASLVSQLISHAA